MALEGNSSASKDSETTRLLQVWDLPIPEDPCMVYSPTLGEKWQHSRGNCRSIFHTWILWVSKGWWWENGVPQVNFLNLSLILGEIYPRQKQHFRSFIVLAIYNRAFPYHSIATNEWFSGQRPNLCRLSRIFFKKNESRTRCKGVSSPGVVGG